VASNDKDLVDPELVDGSTFFGYFEPPRRVQAPGFPHDHEVRVWLPPTYRLTERTYPTLWVTDNYLEIAHSALICSPLGVAPELIVVAIGVPRDSSTYSDFGSHRLFDFIPDPKWISSETMRRTASYGGAADYYRDFLVDTLRPQLEREYRMDAQDHGLFGHSAGCAFTTYCFFSRPDGFSKYLGSSGFALDYEGLAATYMTGREDVSARVYLSAGSGADAGMDKAVQPLADLLNEFGFPSLEVTANVFPGQDHFSVVPMAMVEGVRWLWRETVDSSEWSNRASSSRQRERVAEWVRAFKLAQS
jgi:uncharacterized protein